ncbi:prolyl-tRNA synthetase [Sphaerosporella brunnea]|uniref:proline--tRNA ligase n=1 Tax=Sphaerosporella brunnea TaxID=1250544 RepID=A0A5J5EFS6_9PEZI|nr:prolyl-tRNA synthetase [Sphaerosporella brunnea]
MPLTTTIAGRLRPLRTPSALLRVSPCLRRNLTIDHRQRLSNFFAPSGGIAPTTKDGSTTEDVHALLLRTGYLRQAYSGIFHYLPLGLRVHEKLEKLIDKHMRTLGASKLSLSTISTEKLWEKTGRMGGTEFMRFKDRKGTKFLLAPTHEEEVTALVGGLVASHKQLPLRVYQVGRKYRDERRPRAGLLRGREFTMKDLYTFDATEEAALETYAEVQVAYRAIFDELGLPYLVAEADSGSMGGNMSHEYLYPSATGEDTILSCTSCSYTANTEAAVPRAPAPSATPPAPAEIGVHHAITADRKTLINTYYFRSSVNALETRAPNEINLHRIKEVVPTLDPSVLNPLELFYNSFVPFPEEGHSQIINLFDRALPYTLTTGASFSNHTDHAAAAGFTADKRIPTTSIAKHPSTGQPLTLIKPRVDDHCPRCADGRLKSTTAVELGHTFHLGARYTSPLGAIVFNAEQQRVPMQQGCHGLGVSRMIAAIAEGHRDSVGLGWPAVVAPFEVCVVCHPEGKTDADMVYDLLSEGGGRDVVVDDRERELVWKMKDADLVGYPVFVVLGRAWKKDGLLEVQSRRKALKALVKPEELRSTVEGLLESL